MPLNQRPTVNYSFQNSVTPEKFHIGDSLGSFYFHIHVSSFATSNKIKIEWQDVSVV